MALTEIGNRETWGVIRGKTNAAIAKANELETATLNVQTAAANAASAASTAQSTANAAQSAASEADNKAQTAVLGLETKVDKITGKGLSTADYTAEEKTKLGEIAANANNYQHPLTHSIAEVSGLEGELDIATRTAYDAQNTIADTDIGASKKGITKFKWTFLQLYNYVKGKLDGIYAQLSGFNSFVSTSFTIAEFVRDGAGSARVTVRNSLGTLSTIMDANSTTGAAFGSGTATDVSYVTGQTARLKIFHSSGNIIIQNGGTMTDAGYRLDIQGTQRVTGNITLGTALITSGSGSPEGVVTAPVGSTYSRTDGGANTSLYIKESGVGNTGWIAK